MWLLLLIVITFTPPNAPVFARNPSSADLRISDITLYRIDWWDAWNGGPDYYFRVTEYGVVDVGTRVWNSEHITGWAPFPPPTLHDQPQFDLDSLPPDRSVRIDFAVIKKGLWGWWETTIYGISQAFKPGQTPSEHLFGVESSITFKVVLDWNPQSTSQPPSSQTNTVYIFSFPHECAGQDPAQCSQPDLGVSVLVQYVGNGQTNTMTINTPSYVEADVGSQIALTVAGSLPNWNPACLWDNYGHQQFSTCGTFYTQVYSGPMKIAAFFDRREQPPPPPPPPQSTQKIVIKSVDSQYWNNWNPSTSDLGFSINVIYTQGGTTISTGGYTPFPIQADQGTQIRLIVPLGLAPSYAALSPSACCWTFQSWNWYGDTYYEQNMDWTTSVRGIQISETYYVAALFSYKPPTAPPNTSQSLLRSALTSVLITPFDLVTRDSTNILTIFQRALDHSKSYHFT